MVETPHGNAGVAANFLNWWLQVPDFRLEKLLRLLQEVSCGRPLQEAADALGREYSVDPQQDLNKLSEAELDKKKKVHGAPRRGIRRMTFTEITLDASKTVVILMLLWLRTSHAQTRSAGSFDTLFPTDQREGTLSFSSCNEYHSYYDHILVLCTTHLCIRTFKPAELLGCISSLIFKTLSSESFHIFKKLTEFMKYHASHRKTFILYVTGNL